MRMMSCKWKIGVFALVLLALLFGPCLQPLYTPQPTATVEAAEFEARARPIKGQVLSVDGEAFGAKSRFGGRFNWRGKYKGFYLALTGISHEYSYVLDGATYYPMVEWDGRFKGSWVRDKSTVKKVTWRDSRVWHR